MSASLRPSLLAPFCLALALVGGLGCKKEAPTCEPSQVEWGVQLLVEASPSINLAADGEPLPTVVRLYQVRGELALADLDFHTLWAAEDTASLGESFASVEEMTLFPGQREQRMLPVDPEATHILAAAWLREPMGTTWFATYEIPRRHPEVVCDRAPVDKVYPDPCLYLLLDRSLLSGGETPPSGFTAVQARCAPLGAVPRGNESKKDKRKKKRKERRKKRRSKAKRKASELDLRSAPSQPSQPSQPAPAAPRTPTPPARPTAPAAPSVPRPSTP